MIEIGSHDPIDLHEFMNGRRAVTSEEVGLRRLCLAVLSDAIQCYRGEPQATPASDIPRHKREAEYWFWTRDKGGQFTFSYQTVCEILGIEGRGLWRRIRESTTEALPRARRSPAHVAERIGNSYHAPGADA